MHGGFSVLCGPTWDLRGYTELHMGQEGSIIFLGDPKAGSGALLTPLHHSCLFGSFPVLSGDSSFPGSVLACVCLSVLLDRVVHWKMAVRFPASIQGCYPTPKVVIT